MLIGAPVGLMGGGIPSITQGIKYNGSSQYTVKITSFTGVADGATGIASLWFRKDVGGSSMILFRAADGYCEAAFGSDNKLSISLKDSSHTFLWQATNALAASSTWHHLLVSWNTNAAAGAKACQVYLDDAVYAGTKYDSDGAFSVTYTRTPVGIGADGYGGNFLNGCIAEFYLNYATLLDLSVVGNRAKFISGGKPVSLGATGSLPTGTAPIIFQRIATGGVASDFQINRGTGGDFTNNGTPTLSDTNP